MAEDLNTLGSWQRRLRSEYSDVQFETTDNPRGMNAICEGVLVGRFFEDRQPPCGVVYRQQRSCGGKPFQ